jgi:hypothetical protein
MVAASLANLGRGRPGKNGPIGPISQEEAAQLLNVGVRSVKRAAKIKREAPAPVAEAVAGERAPPSAPARSKTGSKNEDGGR